MRHQHQQKSPQHESGQRPLLSGTGTNSACAGAVVVETLEHRRFAEFCDACKRYRYIGLCYMARRGSARRCQRAIMPIGKTYSHIGTVSARPRRCSRR